MSLSKSADLMSYKYDYYNGLRRFTPDAKITVPEHLNLLTREEQDDFLLYNKIADITDADGEQEVYSFIKRFNVLEFQKLPLADKLITLRAYKNFYGTDEHSQEIRKYYKIKHNSIEPGHVYYCDVRHIKYVSFSRFSFIEDIFDKCVANTAFAKLLIDVVLLELIIHLIKLQTIYLWDTVIQLLAKNIVSHIDRYVCVKVLAQFLLGLLHTVPHDDSDGDYEDAKLNVFQFCKNVLNVDYWPVESLDPVLKICMQWFNVHYCKVCLTTPFQMYKDKFILQISNIFHVCLNSDSGSVLYNTKFLEYMYGLINMKFVSTYYDDSGNYMVTDVIFDNHHVDNLKLGYINNVCNKKNNYCECGKGFNK
ncbi:hypothetical protein HaMNV_gp100 [Helicoverpa armigera multiple nucleopolyhedrovirus]|uniref:Orf100 n=1 Tax=Mamestra brassicae nuclear polyhedrosis virus TaxID=78219 RepID=A0A077D3K6_NPVMB|nr:hypothetical protein HaMNV_gp100 [Helicoverpa armigera multiple nucleopolyhedrovirus]AIL25178.1 Orf100 [Mamestra brassicae multiple nucleopolyhedrovirus]